MDALYRQPNGKGRSTLLGVKSFSYSFSVALRWADISKFPLGAVGGDRGHNSLNLLQLENTGYRLRTFPMIDGAETVPQWTEISRGVMQSYSCRF